MKRTVKDTLHDLAIELGCESFEEAKELGRVDEEFISTAMERYAKQSKLELIPDMYWRIINRMSPLSEASSNTIVEVTKRVRTYMLQVRKELIKENNGTDQDNPNSKALGEP